MKLMETYRQFDYIQIICIALVMVIGKNVGFYPFFLKSPFLRQLILAMEHHSQSHHVYTVACSALGALLRSGRDAFYYALLCNDDDDSYENQVFDLHSRALSCICFGLIIHQGHPTASETGRSFLCYLVGPSIAAEMVFVFEQEQLNASYIAAAAA